MARTYYQIAVVIVLSWLPGLVWACAYPPPLRAISATLISVQDTGGYVGTLYRARLHRALGQTYATTLIQGIGGELARAERRRAAAVLAMSVALAKGRGRTLSAQEADQVQRLATDIRTACPADTNAKAPDTTAQLALEQDHTGATGGGVPALTFRQGLARLSLTFTIYMTFLSIVIGLRMQWKRSKRRLDNSNMPPPGGRAFSPKQGTKVSGI